MRKTNDKYKSPLNMPAQKSNKYQFPYDLIEPPYNQIKFTQN